MADHEAILLSETIADPSLEPQGDCSDDDSSDPDVSEEEGLLDSEEDISGEEDENEASSDEELDESRANPGWADAMAKILKTNKPKRKKSIVLSKAKKLGDVTVKDETLKPGFEIVGDVKEEKPDIGKLKVEAKSEKQSAAELKAKQKLKKFEWHSKGRSKPNILDKDRERMLSKIGTKGVVQLFNALQKQKGVLDSKLKGVGPESTKRDRILKTIDKRAFLDVVMGAAKSQLVDNPVKEEKNFKEEDSKPLSWKVLRDDFMMGGNYKDWDREESKPDISDAMEDESDTSSDD